MKLYKFRSLGSCKETSRIIKLIETGEFWCSQFSELNDPREGGFSTTESEKVKSIFQEKMGYKICSFSSKDAFSNPLMWCYYANGFRGVAIEVEVEDNVVKKMNYSKKVPELSGNNPEIALSFLTNKLNYWKHEYEYRFIKEANENRIKIGKITALYFGEPYQNAVNREDIYQASKVLLKYEKNKNSIIERIISDNTIELFSVKMVAGKVEKNINLRNSFE